MPVRIQGKATIVMNKNEQVYKIVLEEQNPRDLENRIEVSDLLTIFKIRVAVENFVNFSMNGTWKEVIVKEKVLKDELDDIMGALNILVEKEVQVTIKVVRREQESIVVSISVSVVNYLDNTETSIYFVSEEVHGKVVIAEKDTSVHENILGTLIVSSKEDSKEIIET